MRKVLLVDDEGSHSEIIRFFIRKNNLPLEVVGEAGDGERALAMIKKMKPDIVFMDIEMPGMNGLQVMERVRKEYSGKISFIVVTAYDNFDYIQRALRMGASDYLLKPVMYEQFCDSMKRVIGYRYSDNPAFNQALEYIDNHFAEQISMEDLEMVLNMGSSNIARMFKKYLNQSFVPYLNEVRMRNACRLLDEGVAIKEAADRSGFNNLNYFYRVFKAAYDMTPKEYVEKRQD